MENRLEIEASQQRGKNIVSIARKSLNFANLRKRIKPKKQKLESQYAPNLKINNSQELLESEEIIQQQQQSAPLLETRELPEESGVAIVPPPQDATPLEINKQELQESGEPNSEVASKLNTQKQSRRNMEILLEKRLGKNIASIGRKSLNFANLRKRIKPKQQKLEGSHSLTTSCLETQELQQESESQYAPNLKINNSQELLESEEIIQQQQQQSPLLETRELPEESRVAIVDATPLEINKQELQESGEPNSEVASKLNTQTQSCRNMENLLEKRFGKIIVSIGRKSLNLASNLRIRIKPKQQKLEGSQSLTTSFLETQELQQESEQQSAPVLESQELLEESGGAIAPLPPPTPLEINRSELQESGEPNSKLASKVERIFFVINILAEFLSVGFDNLSSLNKHRYALIAMIMSYAAAIVSIIELAYNARKERVVWRWESMLPWFYHSSSPNYRPFSTVPEMTGLVCAILQTISSTVAYALYLQHVKYSFNVSLLPLVLALAIFYSRFMKKPNAEVLSKRFDNIELNQVRVQVP